MTEVTLECAFCGQFTEADFDDVVVCPDCHVEDPGWRAFEPGDLKEAYTWKRMGGIAVHLNYDIPQLQMDGKRTAHLLVEPTDRLVEVATDLGLAPFWIQNEGMESEHFDIWGEPLGKALSRCRQ